MAEQTDPGQLTVTVGLLTYRRPGELAQALPAVLAQAAAVEARVEVLVVDNDPAGSARHVVRQREGLRYVVEPVPGIAAARNRVLDESRSQVVVFIDDDERPGPDWLRSLLTMHLQHRPSGVVGPVVSRFAVEPDPWIRAGRFFVRRRLPTGTPVEVAATNNLLLDLQQLRERRLRFDERLGLTGGSDTMLTLQLTRGGGVLLWCAEAVVFDVVPAERLTRAWVLRRAFRTGNSASGVRVALAADRSAALRTRVTQVVQGLTRVAGGAAQLSVSLLTRRLGGQACGARRLARGAGLVTGAVGHVYVEYRRPAA